MVKKIEDNVVGFDEELQILGKKAKTLHNLCESNINKLAELVILCREEFILSSKLQKRLDLFENLKGLGEVSSSQVDELVKLYENNLEVVKKEKWRRQTMEMLSKSNNFCNKQNKEFLDVLDNCFSNIVNTPTINSSNKQNRDTQNMIFNGVSNTNVSDNEEDQQNKYFNLLSKELKRDKKNLEELALGAMSIDKEQIRAC